MRAWSCTVRLMLVTVISGALVLDRPEPLPPVVQQRQIEAWTSLPSPVPDVLRSTARQFIDEYRSKLRTFEAAHEVAPGVVVRRTGGHTPGHSVVHVASGGERLTFAGDALFPVAFDHPDWHNGFEHDPEESVRVRVRLLRDAAASGELLVATHLPFPSVGRVAVEGDAFRWVASFWDY